MIDSPWEIKITSFGESLLLSSSTHMQVVPNIPFSLSPPLTSPGNSSAIIDHFNALLSWVSAHTWVSLHIEMLCRNTCPSKHFPVMCKLVRIFQQITSTDENISPVPSVKEGWALTPSMTWIKVWGKWSIWYILLPWWPPPLESQVISVCWQNDL